MKINTMFGDIVVSLFHHPITEKYPFERREAPERLRGQLQFNPESCTGCGLCVKDCPAEAIEIIVVDKANKQFVLRYNIDRCTFCAQCVNSCRQECLSMSDKLWELAGYNRESMLVYYGTDENVKTVLENRAR